MKSASTAGALVAGIAGLLAGGLLDGAVRISEIMYNPPGGRDLEYVEIHNDGAAGVDIGGWSFTAGIRYTFPAGATLPAGARFVVCRSVESFRSAYPDLPGELVFGNYSGALANEGETLTLAAPGGSPSESVVYDDAPPWDILADGFGASLERLCPGADPDGPENWRAGRVPADPEGFGGSPGAPNDQELCPPQLPERPPVFLSEILYHPVLEDSLEDEHEFIEIHNGGGEVISLAGWRIAGGVEYTFPEGASIAPGAYRVIARNRDLLAAVTEYGLAAADLLGNYERTLDNGGEKVALIGADGQGVDVVTYDDDFPWPIGADALGAGESWLREELRPLSQHRYRGHSLERVSFEVSSGEIANWAPSPVDGPTPGKANASARRDLLPIVAGLSVQSLTGDGELIRDGEEVIIQAAFSPASPSGGVELEHFIEDVEVTDEPVTMTVLRDDGTAGDFIAGDGVYSATLAGQPENTIVRYRVRADRGAGMEVVSPRPTDPHGWHAYFVSPVIETDTRVYQIFISPVNWGRMWANISPGRVPGGSGSCQPANPNWNSKVDAIFIHEGRVFDAHVRYQGSRWNRDNGRNIPGWRFPRPRGGSVLALSWRIALPRYNQLEGRGVIVLNKLQQGCPGYNAGVGYRLFAEAGVPSPQTRYARLHINGGYYHYMMEYERPGEDMLRRYHREMAEKNPGQPRERIGHLFKSAGCNCDEGPYGWGDERPLRDRCGFTREFRYQMTYDRKTHEWDSHAAFIDLLDELDRVRRSGDIEAIRNYFIERFDMELLLNYLAIINWSVPFDDMFQNHFLYQRRSDDRWILTPWDLDRNFGEWKGASSSIFVGERGDRDNRSGWWNYLKDAFFQGFRQEFQDHLLLMNNTILHPDNVARLVDLVTEESNPQEAARAPAGAACSFPGRAASFNSFALSRHRIVNRLAGIDLDAGPDQTVFQGEVVQFDASDSEPDAGPDVTYTWSNGMEGEKPTFVFQEPGVFEITLTVTARGVGFTDVLSITVLPLPEMAFVESDGEVVMEAESFFMNDPHGQEDVGWEADTQKPGFSGEGYVEAKFANRPRSFRTRYVGIAPELRYAILFQRTGVYRVWMRGLAATSGSDTGHVNLGGVGRGRNSAQRFPVDAEAFLWSGDTLGTAPQEVTVTRPGLHHLAVWISESGLIIDKIILTQDVDFTPADEGPPETFRRSPSGDVETFLRGDVNRNSRLDISDAVGILFHLFRGMPIACEDHGDVNDSGGVELTDAVALLGFIFQRGAPPAPPFPVPGFDTTADPFDCGSP